MKMASAMFFACTCAPVFQGDLAKVVHANGEIELGIWSARIANQSSQESGMRAEPQLGESMFDLGMAAL